MVAKKSRLSVFLIFLACFCVFSARAQSSSQESINKLRSHYANMAFNNRKIGVPDSVTAFLQHLDEHGIFRDRIIYEDHIYKANLLKTPTFEEQQQMGLYLTGIMNRLYAIAWHFKNDTALLPQKFWLAIQHYGSLELSRVNDKHRFHASCFAIPQAATGIYFIFFKLMENVEHENNPNPLLKQSNETLKQLAMQSWTQPFRQDDTDKNVVQVERFRNHVWWVGGNALAYRPLLETAMMFKSAEMAAVVADVAQKSLSNVAQATYKDAFWIEGFTADGAGWGHGRQALVWGYPIHGGASALSILSTLQGTMWSKRLNKENTAAILNFLRGSSFYYYKGFIPPCLDRYSMVYYRGKSDFIPYMSILKACLNNWAESFTRDELKELKQLEKEVLEKNIQMPDYPQGLYSGTKWFYNNDDLIKNTPDYHLLINMASNRCDGLESAKQFADEYNFFTNDGLTFFQRDGDEYRKIIGAMDVTATAGITARQGEEYIIPVTNWSGYCSKFNYAGGATFGGNNAVAGFIFEKMNAEAKDRKVVANNPYIYNVKAHKSYFVFGDYLIALGAGITNGNKDLPGTIRTTIDQTALRGKPFRLENGIKMPLSPGIQMISANKSPIWIGQDGGFMYSAIAEYSKDLFISEENKPNHWVKRNLVNKGIADLPTHADIFKVWVDHGHKANEEKYAYTVYLGKDMPSKSYPFKVLMNDTLAQCVQSVDKRTIGAVIHKSSAKILTSDFTFSSSHPCVILIENKPGMVNLSISDPTMDSSVNEMKININNKIHIVQLPVGKERGKPATLKLNLSTN